MTTLNTYGHMWPDADESARAAVHDVHLQAAGAEQLLGALEGAVLRHTNSTIVTGHHSQPTLGAPIAAS